MFIPKQEMLEGTTMTTNHRSKVSVLSMLLGMGVSVLLCVLTGASSDGGAAFEDVESVARVEVETLFPEDELIARPAQQEDEKEVVGANSMVRCSFPGGGALHGPV